MIAKILAVSDYAGYKIHACPYCKRYVKREKGIRYCLGCGRPVDNNHAENYEGRIIFTGGQSWLRHISKSKIKMEPL